MEKIDRKFIILAVNPVTGKIYTDADGFFVCAKDVSAPDAVEGLIRGAIEARSNHEHIESLKLLCERVLQFQVSMGGGRTPDTIGAEIPRCLNGEGVNK
jgi:hypothetical protein